VKTRTRITLALAGLLALSVICCFGLVTVYVVGGYGSGGSTANAQSPSTACGQDGAVAPAGKLPKVSSLTPDQTHDAAVIIAVGQQRKVPPRGWVIAIATALQESGLRNLPNLGSSNDHDSLGLFQQRPSQGWGTPAQILDPAYAATKFYEHLVRVRNWQTIPLTNAAQAVQRSAFPNAYAKHEPLATAIVNALANGAARGVGALTESTCTNPGQIAASGWTVPLTGFYISSGFRTAERPTHNGVDLAVARGTVIHAASAGVVSVVACQASTSSGAFYSCDLDGGLNICGCGWYVEIEHAGGIITRYCHMESRPLVTVGQQVTAGQPIGHVGMSGHASGPHCHFEVHINGDRSPSGAIDPIIFMTQQGAPLSGKP
jgi:murein DD-endopeptidase MepM/ murein hydrolase activator NlpD